MDKSRDTQSQENQSRDEIEETLKRLIEQNEALKQRNHDLHKDFAFSAEKKKAPEVIKERRPENAPAVSQGKKPENGHAIITNQPKKQKNIHTERTVPPRKKEPLKREPTMEKTQVVPPMRETAKSRAHRPKSKDETKVMKIEVPEKPITPSPVKPKKKKRTSRKVVKGFLIAILVTALISLICGLFVTKPNMTLFGVRFYTTANDNMAPEITSDDTTLVKKIPLNELNSGDIILTNKKDRSFAVYDSTIRENGKEIIHVHDRENCYKITEKDYMGKALFKLHLGRISRYAIVHTYNYYAALISSSLICIGLLFLIPGMGEKEKKKKSKNGRK